MSDIVWQPVTVPLSALVPWDRNPKTISKAHANRLLDLWQRLGQFQTIAIGPAGEVYDGHQRLSVLKAAHGPRFEVTALQADRALTEKEREELTVAAHVGTTGQFSWEELSGWDTSELQTWGFDAELLQDWNAGAAALATMLDSAQDAPPDDPGPQIDRAEELREKWQTAPGQMWQLGEHRVICGDCREPATWERLLGGVKANGVFTSPPYAEQRKEQYGGVPADEYVEWWEAVQGNVKANLAGDGSFFVNIKPHCEDGERVLYVFDLVLAMCRRWGWRYVDELCWSHQGVPGYWPNRFKNGFEPVYHFAGSREPRFRPKQVSEKKSSAFKGKGGGLNSYYDPDNSIEHSTESFFGDVLPANILRLNFPSATSEFTSHGAQFPVALPDFFIRAYSDAGDVWVDPFCGSGTVIIAAHNNKRRGMGIELLPKYVAVILQRWADLTGRQPVLLDA